MSESMTAKRIWAARTARRFPVVLTMVAAGELHLSGINLLGKHLTDANHRAILARATHKSSREIEILVAELAPRSDVPSRVRALPGTPGCVGRADAPMPAAWTPKGWGVHGQGVTAGVPVGATSNEPYGGIRDKAAGESRGTRTDASADDPAAAARAFPGESPAGAGASRPTCRKAITALAPRRYKIEITVDQDTHDQLRALQDLLRHELPSADPALILSRAIELLLDHTLKKKAALTKATNNGSSKDGPARVRTSIARTDGTPSEIARTNRAPTSDAGNDGGPSDVTRTNRDPHGIKANRAEPKRVKRTRAIPAAIRREVWKRDRGRCTFTDAQGRRCRETSRIEYHHHVPYGKGGRHETANIALRCRAHNQYQADLDFGRVFMRRKRTEAALHSARNVRRTWGGLVEERDVANARAVSAVDPSR